MDGWVDRGMDGRTDRQTSRRMNGWMDAWTHGRMDGWMDEWMDECVPTQTCTHAFTHDAYIKIQCQLQPWQLDEINVCATDQQAIGNSPPPRYSIELRGLGPGNDVAWYTKSIHVCTHVYTRVPITRISMPVSVYHACTEGRTDGRTDGWTDAHTHARTHACTHAHTQARTQARTHA